MPINY